MRNTLNIQPVIPFKLGRTLNVITRVIVPVIFQPDISKEKIGYFGLADINPSFFFSPAHPGNVIWGVGPSFLLQPQLYRNWERGNGLQAPVLFFLFNLVI